MPEEDSDNVYWADINLETPLVVDNSNGVTPNHVPTLDSLAARPINPFDDQIDLAYSISEEENRVISGNNDDGIQLSMSNKSRALSVIEVPARRLTGTSLNMPRARWYSPLLTAHAVTLLNLIRGVIVIPLIALALLVSITGTDWQHTNYKSGSTEITTYLGLSTIQKVTSQYSSEGSSTAIENPISFNSIYHDKRNEGEILCNAALNEASHKTVLGEPPVLNMTAIKIDRKYRFALFNFMHGPVFREVYCKAIYKLYASGVSTMVFACFGLTCLLLEWFVVFIHMISRTRMRDAKLAYAFSCRIIELNHFSYSNQPGRASGLPYSEEAGIVNSPEPSHPDSNYFTGVVLSISRQLEQLPAMYNVSWRVMVEHIWWRPIGCFQQWVGIVVQRGKPKYYILISLLEGPSTFFSALQCLFLTISCLIYADVHRESNCLSGDMVLVMCSSGKHYYLLWLSLILCGLHFMTHIYSARLTMGLERIQPMHIFNEDPDYHVT